MTELSRSLIAAAREGLAPDPDVAARVRARVSAAVAASAAVATGSHATAATGTATGAPTVAPSAATTGATTATSTATSTATPSVTATVAAGSSSLAAKLGVALVLLGAASVGVGLVARDADHVPDVPPLSVTSGAVEEIPAGERVAAPDDPLVLPDVPRSRDKATAPNAAPVQSAAPATVAAPPSAQPEAAPEPASMPESASTPEPASLSREVELIDLAMVSLRKNAPLAAIEAIRVFERETFGKGQMAEEAAAIEIEARCKLREDVTAALARFDRKWPESAQRERIQTACFARK